ncbi:hypothetical protein A3F02_02630 [Candidatus Curtissbacteria bacterium RIFCSPHIGHO2_12_FULL_38_9b]|uniref:Type II secretion system protein GspG C-terminal domain-containing protein n=2 Tax=Candidatus Curtissiibacteriota TaxID=1752717 RepID=A0A1F5GY79_9BACT|nr:MAG: hypothetical protein A3A48_01115 [Candidatus Curtissbacteria bacterium RIFCSPLOWO2_01_FULL_37_9]OGD96764.1 MAG: hypothetical protein A3F02_02630 [Candidatus Curtissbacteria bacterium RIFCSPHIGHO2_12_FULL_38_9b]
MKIKNLKLKITLRGFTLIELLIVMGILAILAVVIMMAINPAKRQKQARDATRKSDIGQIANALNSYFSANSLFPVPSGPASISGLTSLRASGDLKIIPFDPVGNEYQYLISSTGNNSEVALYAALEDATSGVGDWVWCWRSASVSVGEITEGGCTP